MNKLDNVSEPESAPPLDALAIKDIMATSATIYECGIYTGTRLGGMQKKRHLATCSTQWSGNTSGLGAATDTTPSKWVHPALLAVSKS